MSDFLQAELRLEIARLRADNATLSAAVIKWIEDNNLLRTEAIKANGIMHSLRADNAEMLAALKRIMAIESRCDEADEEITPDKCPAIQSVGEMCHQCEARAAIARAEGRDEG